MTSPRIPCAVFGRFLGQESWVRHFTQRGLPGAYLRVERRGPVRAGDPVRVLDRPGHGVTVARWSTAHDPGDARALLKGAERGEVTIGPALRAQVERAAART